MSELQVRFEPGDDLRRHFTNPPPGEPAAGNCPPAESIWNAVRRDVTRSELEHLVDHVAACPACTVAWTFAREQYLEENPSARAASREDSALSVATTGGSAGRFGGWTLWAPAAAAAVVVVAIAGVAVTGMWPGSGDPATAPGFRVGQAIVISPLVPDGKPLPRSEFVLRWKIEPSGAVPAKEAEGAPEGTTWSITVTDTRLDPVAARAGLTEPEFVVPEEALSRIEAGARILWRVEAKFPDGYRVASKTFVARVE